MPKSTDSTLNVTVRNDGDVSHTFTRDQVFDPEDYIEIYENTREQVEELKGDINELEEEIADGLDENEGMAALHTVLNSEPQEHRDLLEENSVGEEDLEKYRELQQKKEKRQKMVDRKTQIMQELDSMKPVIEELREKGYEAADD